ncbi:S-layer homology domain-containing protein [Actinomarinicola tropica]|uniref:SLH domain-containing protein n=1 Tax=Actinomarinicola tropica TaxID=2789776 RepID=A0A5Q2RGT1_9ACTN|nr:S-layer homology domain-containing protein [Actinomarinicola tropica]QGG93741.1 hypothetical protein GH723_00670 [Actinomarinicola tropica]
MNRFTASVALVLAFTGAATGPAGAAPPDRDAVAVTARPLSPHFSDVPPGAYYATPVGWLVERRLTTGVGGTGLFQPDTPVTRAQVATFLHRLAGSPPARPAPHIDVRRDAYYTAAVGWVYETGTMGSTDGPDRGDRDRPFRFSPDRPMTRGDVVITLWVAAGTPWGHPPTTFPDASTGYILPGAVAWAEAEGITTGVGGTGLFQPDALVTRGQLATFLHRLHGR